MFTTFFSYIKNNLRLIVVAVIGLLVASTVVSARLYIKEKEAHTKTESALELVEQARVDLTLKLNEERETARALATAERSIEYVYVEVEKEVDAVPSEECLPAPNPTALAGVLCRNGLATTEACDRAITTVSTSDE